MSTRTFGIVALGDPNFVTELGLGRNPRLSTVDPGTRLHGRGWALSGVQKSVKVDTD